MTRTLWVTSMLALTACASLKNTPQQDCTWELGRVCDARSNFVWTMTKVETDGFATIKGNVSSVAAGFDEYRQCLREERERRPYSQWLKERGSAAK